MVYLHNFYLNPMFDQSGPRPGADAHNCTVGYVSEYKPPSLYPGVNLTTINDGGGFAQIPHPGLPRETPLVLAANTYADEGGSPLYGSWLECWGYDRSGTWRTLGGTNGGMSAEFTIPGERKEPPQIVFRAPGKAGQRINMWCIFVGAKADYEEFQLLAPGSPFAGNLMPLPLGGGAGLNAVVWLFALTALAGWWPHDADNQPLPQPVVQLAWGIALPDWRFRHHNLHRRAAATATAVDRRWRRAGGTGVDRTAGIDAHGVPVLLLDVRQVAAQRMPVHHRQHGLRLDGAGPWRQPAVQWRPRHGDDRVHHPAGCQWNPDRVRQSPENGRGDGVRPAHAHDQNRLGLVAEEQSRQAALRRSHATQLTAPRLAVAA